MESSEITTEAPLHPPIPLEAILRGAKKQIWVLDKSTGKKFRTNPANIAAVRDLYSVEHGDYVGKGIWHVHNGGWSPDGKSLVYTRDTDQSDIYVIEGYR